MYYLNTRKKQNVNGIGNFIPFEKSAKCKQYSMKLDNFVPFGRPPSGKVIIQVMTKLVVSNKYQGINSRTV